MIKHHYAKNGCDEIVAIEDADPGAIYHCIGCGHEMMAKKGTIREHHFCHRQIVDCNGETYTHQCAKLYIKHLFEQQPHLWISFKQSRKGCLSGNCHYEKTEGGILANECVVEENKQVDLKEYYDTCELEADYNGFVADILLKNSQNLRQKPCFIEIAVTHPCEKNKLASDIPIIEISIPKGSDNFDELSQLVETDKLDCGHHPPKDPKITFHNFKRKIVSNDACNLHDVSVFFVNKNGKGQVKVHKNCCSLYGKQHLEAVSTYEIHFPSQDGDSSGAYTRGVAIANLKLEKRPNCWVCQYHAPVLGDHCCQRDVSRLSSPSQAFSCPDYAFSREKALKLEKGAWHMGYKIVAPRGKRIFP